MVRTPATLDETLPDQLRDNRLLICGATEFERRGDVTLLGIAETLVQLGQETGKPRIWDTDSEVQVRGVGTISALAGDHNPVSALAYA
jgi:hypothetical protein